MIWKRAHDRPIVIAYASYALLLGVILLMWIVSFSNMMRIVESDALTSVRHVLTQGETSLNDNLTSIDRVVTRTMSHPLIRSAMRMKSTLTDANYNLLRRLNDEYSWMLAQETFPSRFFIYFHNSESFVGDFGASARSKMIYDNYFRYTDMTYEQWRGRVTSSYSTMAVWPTANVSLYSRDSRCLTFLYTIQEYGAQVRRATIAALVSEESILASFSGTQDIGVLAVMLVDTQGNLVYSSQPQFIDQPFEFDDISAFTNSGQTVRSLANADGRVLLLRGENATHNLISIAVIDYNVILNKLGPLNRMFAAVFAIAVVVGILLAVALSWLNSRPLRRISQLLQAMPQGSANRSGETRSLDMKIHSIINVNADLAAQLDASQTMLSDTFQERLFLTGFDNMQELVRYAELVSFPLKNGSYTVAVFLLDADESAPTDSQTLDEHTRLRHIALERALNVLRTPPALLHTVGLNRVAALFHWDSEQDAALFMNDNLNGLFPIQLGAASITGCMGISANFDRLTDTRNAYIEADVALDSLTASPQTNSRQAFYADLPITSFALYYPLEKEIQLTRLIRSGDATGANDLLTQIFRQNYTVTPISDQMHRQLAHDLRSTFLRLIADVATFTAQDMKDLYTVILDLHVHTDAEHQLRLFEQVTAALCDAVGGARRDISGNFIANIVAYIQEHCSDPDLTLQSTADTFHLSPSYLSRYIHENSGQTFSVLVEEQQMGLARELIVSTQLPVAAVAERCGYSSVNTFFKAFKRVFGVSPSSMRKLETMRSG